MNVQLPLLPVPETVQSSHHPLVLKHKDRIMKNSLAFWELKNNYKHLIMKTWVAQNTQIYLLEDLLY